MNNYKAALTFLYLSFTSTLALARPDSIIPSGIQISKGNQSPIQNNKNGTNFANYGIAVNGTYIGSLPIARNNTLEAKREALFLVQHPTILEVTNLHWTSWFGDTTPYLNVELTNRSELPAIDVRVSLLNNNSSGTLKKLKPYKLAQSYTMKILKGTSINVGANSKWQWPLSSVSDIQKIVHSDCVIGAGMEYKPVNAGWTEGANGSFEGGSVGIYIKVEYKSIFGEKLGFIVSGVIDSANRKSEIMIPRGSAKAIPLKCIGDAGWNNVELISDQSH